MSRAWGAFYYPQPRRECVLKLRGETGTRVGAEALCRHDEEGKKICVEWRG